MKILILTTKSNWGGAQRYVYDLATGLPTDEYEVEVMAGGNGPLIEKLVAAGINAKGDLAIGRDVSFAQDLKAFFTLFQTLRARKPDVLHLNSSKIGGLGALAGRLAGVKKVVFTAHGWAFNEDRSFISKSIIRFLYWITLILSHETIAVSHAVKSQMINWPFVYKKISVVHNGVSPVVGYSKISARLELTRKFGRLGGIVAALDPKNLFWIGTVAELHHIKGHEHAIRGVHGLITSLKAKGSHKQIIYTVIGAGEEREKLEHLIKELGLENNIFLLGHLDQAPIYIKAFDIFLLASLSEGLAFVLLEAGLASLPVIATTVGGIPEVIDDMKSGILIQSKKASEITHALEFLIEHKNVRKEYGEHLHAKVLNDFSVTKMLESTKEVFKLR